MCGIGERHHALMAVGYFIYVHEEHQATPGTDQNTKLPITIPEQTPSLTATRGKGKK